MTVERELLSASSATGRGPAPPNASREPDTTGTANELGLSKQDYLGGKSTLCVGCGHDSITGHIVTAFFQSSVNP